MKKLLSILGGLGMVGTTSATVVSCKDGEKSEPKEEITTSLGEVLSSPKKMWLDTGLFDSFSNGKIESEKLSELVWTGMFDAHHQGGDSDEAKEGRDKSLKEFKDRELASVITLDMEFTNVKLEKLKEFAEGIVESGEKYIKENDKGTEGFKELEESVKELSDSLDDEKATWGKLSDAINKTIVAIKEFKSHLENPDADEFELIVSEKDNINEGVKLTLEDDLTAHFTTGKDNKIKSDVLVKKGNANFKDLTLILTI